LRRGIFLIVLMGGALSAIKAESQAIVQWVDGALEKNVFVSKNFGLKNITDMSISELTVECGFYDDKNILISTGSEHVFNLAPGDTAYNAVTLPNGGESAVTTKCRWYQN
jgi:hypothetical protein